MALRSSTQELRSDLDSVRELASSLSGASRSEALRDLAELLIASRILDYDPAWRYNEQQNEIVNEEIKERLSLCRSNAFAHELIAMAGYYEMDIDSYLFPDGRADFVLVADSEIHQNAGVLPR